MKLSNRPIIVFDIDYTLFKTSVFKESKLKKFELYEVIPSVLSEFSKFADLGIFSEGDTLLQKKKLKRTKIEHFFKSELMYIGPNKNLLVDEIVKAYLNSRLIVVDDKLTVLYLLKQRMPDIITIWIRRGYYAERQELIEGFVPDETVVRLDEITTVL